MTTKTNTATDAVNAPQAQGQTQDTGNPRSPNPPDYVVKKRNGRGENATWDRLGVAWRNQNGALYLRFHGTQVLSGGVSLYPVDKTQPGAAGA
ncbi:hypothetical protein [Roseospira visakhapatnamensis]|uniref:Uncharacterized protein n=1 Tax=Roseospira visakhapatnamensis TaxID=390880 RepID=A0A7W6RG42_9PROT|nr:hypothetical protein [Roseospira visakhapatnamensis]MBB4267908.1 hypothetical protein [Roseospira visakhapatnamensis]